MTQSQRDLRTFMALAQEAAIADAKLMPTTPDIKRRASGRRTPCVTGRLAGLGARQWPPESGP